MSNKKNTEPLSSDLTLIIDRSGSMNSIRKDVLGGINRFLTDQRKIKGACRVTIHQFDHEFDTIVDNEKIERVESFTDRDFVPRGNTALLDAIVRGVNAALKRHADRNTKMRHRIVVILTDGLENCSKEATNADVKALIQKAEKEGFEFVFLGANQDAFATAQSFGIARDKAMTFRASGQSVNSAYISFSKNIGDVRMGVKMSAKFEPSDYKAQADAGVEGAAP